MPESGLRVQNLRAGYGDLVALNGVSLHVRPGEIVALIGANGAGKSTLLNTLLGMTHLRGGEVFLDGRALTRLTPERIARLGVALVPEGRQLFAPLSVQDNLLLGWYRLRREGKSGFLRRLEAVYALFPVLRERSQQAAGTMSGGEQQMLAIGRALMAEPRLLLLDEPSMGLAPKIAAEIFRTLARLRSESMAILLVEQNSRLALNTADRGYVVETGQIVIEGDRRSLMTNEEVRRAYLGGGFRPVWE